MRPEEKPAYIFAQAVAALAEIESMKAANAYREMRGETIAYGEESFLAIHAKYGLDHNYLMEFFS